MDRPITQIKETINKSFNFLKEKSIKHFDKKFILILMIGIFLRIVSFLYSPLTPDSFQYIAGAKEILKFTYSSFRPPGFPLFIAPFLFIFQDGVIAIKIACFTASFLLIISSYLVFKRAAFKVLQQENKANFVGLLVSFLVSIQYFLAYNNGRGLREDLISLCLILIFYFLLIRIKDRNITHYISIFLLIFYLTLIHVTVGIFFYISFFLYVLFSIFFKLEHDFSLSEFIIVSISFLGSIIFWFTFCFLTFGDPFYTMNIQKSWFRSELNLNLASLDSLITSMIRGITNGIPMEFYILIHHIFLVMIISFILSLFYFRKKRQIKFLIILIVLNLLFLSMFVMDLPNGRLFLYLFPFIFYLGFLFLIEILYKYDKNVFTYVRKTTSLTFAYKDFFIIYLGLIIIANFILFFIGLFDIFELWMFQIM